MAKKRDVVKATEIELGGVKYQLKLDLVAAYDFEQQTGKTLVSFLRPLFEIYNRVKPLVGGDIQTVGAAVLAELDESGALNAGDVMALFWACLGGEDSGKTVREAGRLLAVNTGDTDGILAGFWGSVVDSMPKSEPGEESETEDEPKNAQPTGLNSGQSDDTTTG
jgi:hypothetical protein